MTSAPSTSREVKLSCRNVWKIYGDTAQSHFTARQGDIGDEDTAKAHAQNIRDAGDIVASANVSFDVHVGEIFCHHGPVGLWQVHHRALFVPFGGTHRWRDPVQR